MAVRLRERARGVNCAREPSAVPRRGDSVASMSLPPAAIASLLLVASLAIAPALSVAQTRSGPDAVDLALAWSRGALYVADTANHVIREIDLDTGVIRTALGTGHRGDGPEPDPRQCALNRPHGVLVDAQGVLYVGDSEAHRIRVLG